MKKSLLRILLISIMIVSVIGLVAACGNNDEETPSTPSQSPAISQATTTPQTEASGIPALSKKTRFRVATTSSLYDTGLWSYLEPMFEKKYNVELDVLYANTGIALEYGQRGDVDVIAVHDKVREEKFIADGNGTARTIFAYNYFVIVGPKDDPAGIKGMTAEDAFKKLAQAKDAQFISRGDSSGTHAAEQRICKSAGLTYDDVRKSGGWYVEAGQGMGPTLSMSGEKRAYTLSDIGTFLAYQSKTGLVQLVNQGSGLLNVYSVIPVAKTKSPEMAQNMVAFMTSTEIQKLIGEYGAVQYGQQLFTPCAGQPEPTL